MRLRSILWWFYRFQETRIWRRLTRTRRRDGYRRAGAFRRLRVEGLEPRTVLTASFVGGPITTQNTLEDVASIVQFQIADDSVPLASLTLTATSDNQTVLPNANLALTNLGGGAYQLSSLPAANQYGSGLVTLTITGDGAPVAQSFTLNVTSVNDPPSFTKGADQSILNSAGAQSIPNWATNISPGPNETGQPLTFQVTNDNPSLFTVAPTINSSGTLTYTPSGVLGTAVVSVVLTDGGGTADGGSDTSATQTFAIQVAAPPAAAAGSLDPTFDGDGIRQLTSPQGASDQSREVVIQADGKILALSMTFTGGTLGLSSTTFLKRYNVDGTLDTTFAVGGTFTLSDRYNLTALDVQSNGKILLAGDATIGSGIYVTRLNTDGSVDTTFGTAGVARISVNNVSSSLSERVGMTVQSDDRIIVVRGNHATAGSNMHFAVGRLTASGAVDTTFNSTGFVNVTVSASQNEFPVDAAVQSDGKIVVAGVTNLGAGAGMDFIALRFTSAGALDTSFNSVGYNVVNVSSSASGNDNANRVIIQSDGKILLGGFANADFGLVRFNTDGSLDSTFDGDGKVTTNFSGTDQIFGLLQQSDGTIIAGGTANSDFALARYTSTGALDTAFDGDGKATFAVASNSEQINGIALQSDGKIAFAGTSTDAQNLGDVVVGRFNSNGSIDTTFSGVGYTTSGFVPGSARITSSLQLADGRVLLGGFLVEINSSAAGRRAVWRLLADGSLDTTFGTGGVSLGTSLTQSTVSSLLVQSDGKVLVLDATQSRLTRLNADGTVDTSFGSSGSLALAPTNFTSPNGASSMALLGDGKILIAGAKLNSSTSLNEFAVVRVTSAGAVDTTFDSDGLVTIDVGAGADFGRMIAVQSDGKILAGGYANNGTNDDFALVRLNADGSLDTSFGGTGKVVKAVGSGTDQARALLLQSDGKIVLGGQSSSDFGLVRFLADGTIDTSFGAAGVVVTQLTVGAADDLLSLVRQADGKYLAVGYATVSSVQRIAVVRYLADGALDSSFGTAGTVLTTVGANNNQGQTAYLQPDGKLVVGGFADGNSTASATILRYVTAASPGAPSISSVADQTTLEDTTSAAINFSVSHPTLPAGSLNVTVASGNTALVPNGQLVLENLGGGNWRLTGTPAVNQYGSALITLTVSDGTLSYAETFTLTVTPVNDPPSFTKGADQSSLANAGAVTVAGWATAISPGASDPAQGLTFLVSTDNPSLFSVGPAISSNGTLTYTPSGVLGTAVVTVTLIDDGGTANGGVAASAAQTFTIQINNGSATVPAGALDPTFDGDGVKVLQSVVGAFDSARDVARQSDGKYVAVGWTLAGSNLTATSYVTRFNSDGSLDASFAVNGAIEFSTLRLMSVEVLGDGSILVAGQSHTGVLTVAKLTATGAIDTAFGTAGLATVDTGNIGIYYVSPISLAVQADGGILVLKNSRASGATYTDVAIARFTASGAVDATFNGTGFTILSISTTADDLPGDLILQGDGKIIVAGTTTVGTGSDFFAARFNTNGTLDTSFNSVGYTVVNVSSSASGSDTANRAVLQTDGKILIGGVANGDFGLIRLKSDGTLDATFDGDGKLTTSMSIGGDIIYGLAVFADGSILAAGSITTSNLSDFAFARYQFNGALDTTFDSDGKMILNVGAGNDIVYSLLAQSDGKFVAAGVVTDATNGGDFAIARFNSNGSFDTSFSGDGLSTEGFGLGGAAAGAVLSLADGRILVAGNAGNGFSTGPWTVWMLRPDGSLDTSFGNGGVATGAPLSSSHISALAVQNDGKILFLDGIRKTVGRLLANGAIDVSFGVSGTVSLATWFTTPSDMALESDGTIVFTGWLSGTPNRLFSVVRLNTNGSADTTFDGDGWVTVDMGSSNDFQQSLAIQSDDKIVVAGYANGGSTGDDFALFRLNTNGSLDTTFSGDGKLLQAIGSGSATDQAGAVLVQSDGAIVVAGISSGRTTIVRFLSNGTLDTLFSGDGITTTSFSQSDTVSGLVRQSDGKYVTVGYSNGQSPQVEIIARYTSNGSLDTTFDGDGSIVSSIGGVNTRATVAAVQNDGSLVVFGSIARGPQLDVFGQRFFASGSIGAPSISAVAAQVVSEDASAVIDVTVSDTVRPAGVLSMSVSSDNATLFPSGSLTLTNLSNGAWRLSASAAANLSGSAIVTLSASNGLVSYAETFTLTVNAVNDAPVVDLNGGVSGAGYAATFTEDGGPIMITDAANLSLIDIDSTTLAGATVTITNLSDGAAETLAANVTGTSLSAVYLNGVLTISGVGTVAEYRQVLRTVTYNNSSQAPTSTARQIAFTVTDGAATSLAATSVVTIVPVNDAPTAGANLGLTLAEGATATIGGGLLKTNDVDNTTAQLVYTITNLSVHGTVNLNGAALGVNGTFTQADLDAGNVSYTHNSSENFSDQFTFTVTDGEFTLNSTSFALAITPVNDAPTAGVNLGLTLAEGATAVLHGTRLKTNDVDNAAAQLVYTVTNLPVHGTVNLNGAALTAGGTFTQADLDAGKVTYTHDASENFSDNFQFTVTDGEYALSAATFAVTITPVNDAPTAGANLGLTLAEGATAVLDGTRLKTNDVDNTAAQLVYTVTNLPAHGTVNLNGAALAVNGTFTQADLDDGRVSYTHDSSENFSDQFQFTVTDGQYALSAATFALTITPVNDAPTAGVNLGLTLAEGANGIIGGNLLRTDDVDNSPGQRTYTITAVTTHGALAKNGVALAVGGTFTQADLDAGLIRYTHDSSENFGDNFTFTVADGEYTLSETTFALTITPVNDAPTAGVNLGLTLAEGAAAVLDGTRLKTNDVDNTTAQLVYTVTNLPARGTLNLNGAGLAAGGTFTQADLDAGRVGYTHDSSENFTDSFKFTVTDGEYSLSEATFALMVTPVNDAPTAAVNLGLTLAEGGAGVVGGNLLRTDDVDNSPGQRTYTLTAITAHGALAGNGVALAIGGTFTQADLDAGLIRYTHNSGENFTDGFKFTVSDGGFTLPEATFTLTITPVNDAPTAGVNLGLTLAEGATAVLDGIRLKTNDVDDTTAQLVYAATNLPTHGTVNLNGAALAAGGTFTQADLDAGRVSYTHDSSENFSDELKFTVSDGEYALPEATFALTIAPVNDAPTVGVNSGLTLAEGAAAVVTGGMLRTDDVDNATVQRTYALTAATTHGVLARDGAALTTGGTFTQADLDAGRISYAHDSSESFSDAFSFTVSDGQYTLPVAAFNVTVTPVNDAPTAGANLGLTLAEGSTVLVTAGMLRTNDVDNTPVQLVYTVTNLPTHGTVNLNGTALGANSAFTQADLDAGRISYTHDSSENFADSFKFTVSDGQYALTVGTFALTITPVNDAPTAGANLGLTLAEGATVVLDGTRLRTNDVDNTPAQLVYTVTNLPTYGTLNLNGTALVANGSFTQADLDAGRVTYTHDSSENFADNFRFAISDGQYSLNEATFALAITPVNDAPMAGANLGLAPAEGTTAVITSGLLQTNDVDSSAAQLVYTVTNLPTYGTLNLNGTALGTNGTFTQADLDAGRVTYTHDSSENFSDHFKFTVTDGQYSQSEATFALIITPVNDAPTAGANLGLTLAEGATVVLDGTRLRASDVDNTTAQLVYAVSNLPAHGTVNLNGAVLATNGTFTQADLDSGRVTYTHDSSENFTDGFKFTVTDGGFTLPEATFALMITPVNDAPTAGVNLGLTLAEGATAVVNGVLLKTHDVDNTAAQLSYAVVSPSTHGTLNLNGAALAAGGMFTQADLDAGNVTYTHDSSENFADNFKFIVADGEFALSEATFALTITPVNDAPTAGANLGLTLAEGATVVLDGTRLKTNDVDNTSAQLVYTVTNLPAHGTVNFNGVALAANGAFTQADLDAGRVGYTHDSSENFTDQFQFTVTDGEYSLTSATFALNITPVNDAPTAGVNLGLTLAEGGTATIAGGLLQTNDVDNSAAELVYTVTNLPAHGTVNLNGAALAAGGTFTQADLDDGRVGYTHDSSENFVDQFQFTVADGEYALSEATFALVITPVNDAPVVAPQNFILYNKAVAGTIVGAVQASDRDAGQQRSFAIVGGNGALAINASTGVLTVVNSKLLVGTALNFVVRVTDDGVPPLATDALISVSLRAADAPPTFAVVDGASAPLAVVNNQVKLTLDERTDVTATRNGLVIATLAAADVDEPGVVFPLIMTDRSGAFAFDAATGKLSILDAAKLDYEKTRSFTLSFKATDHGLVGLPKPVTSTLTMTVQLTDRNDAPTVAPAATFKLKENNGAKVTVGTVKAADADGPAAFKNLQYAIVSQRDAAGDDVGIFSIDAARGTLMIAAAGALNYEAQPQYTVVVRARDAAGLFADQTVTVQVIDVNEAVVLALLDAAQNPTTGLTVPENTANGTLVGYLRIDNPDVTRPETFKITLGDNLGKAFAVGAFDAVSRLAPITVFNVTKLNFEAIRNGQFTLSFTVSDSGFTSNDGSKFGGVTVNKTYNSLVADVNEAPTAVAWKTVGLPSGTAPIPAGTLFGTALGVDPDKTPQAFTYSLPSATLNNDLFTIDPLTGQLRSSLALGRKGVFNLLIRVTDAGGLFFNQSVVIKT